MLISQGYFRICKNHNVILLILLTLLKKTGYAVKSIEKSTTLKNLPGLKPRCAMCTLRL